MSQGISQAQRIQEIGLGAWLDEPMDLNEFYGNPDDNKTERHILYGLLVVEIAVIILLVAFK